MANGSIIELFDELSARGSFKAVVSDFGLALLDKLPDPKEAEV